MPCLERPMRVWRIVAIAWGLPVSLVGVEETSTPTPGQR